MVGLCAAVDSPDSVVGEIASFLSFFSTEDVLTFDFERATVACVVHDPSDVIQVTTSEATILLYGQVHTVEIDGHHRVVDGSAVRATLEKRYEEVGPAFAADLNGEFVAIVETDVGNLSVVTDRLSTKPIFSTSAGGGTVLSTNLPGLLSQLDREFTWDDRGLIEYLTFGRVFGTETPVHEIEQVPPATVRTVEPDASSTDETYWFPSYRPQKWGREALVRKLADLLSTILNERLSSERSYGLLLSGGSDSRLFLAASDGYDFTAYTLGDWWNREVDIAYTAASKAGVPFIFLRRDRDYQRRLLEESPRMCNFVSRFNQAHALGFADRLSREVDVLINGMFADTFFKGHFLPVLAYDTPVGEFNPPIRRRFESVSDYVSHLGETSGPPFLDADSSLSELLAPMFEVREDTVRHHGVDYGDLEQMVATSAYYPLTNQKDVLLYESLNHVAPTITPFLDHRLIDLHLTIPVSMQLRGGLINAALTHLSPDQAALPHSGTNVPPNKPYLYHFLGYNLTRLRRNMRSPGGEPWYSNDPWSDHAGVIRANDFVLDCLTERAETIGAIDSIDPKRVHEVYDSHIRGADHWQDLYSLVTVLSMPGVGDVRGK